MVKVKLILSLLALGIVVAVTYTNCTAEHVHNSSSAASAGMFTCADNLDNLTLFSKTYQPFLMNNCSSCHSGGGPGPGAFASSGVQLAYTSFSSLGFSLINTKALDGHSPASGPQNTSQINDLSTQWVSGLQTIQTCGQSGSAGQVGQVQDDPSRFQTVSHAINPDVNGPVTVTWNLQTDIKPNTGYNSADFQNVSLSAKVEIFQRPGIFAYVISNPSISTTTSDIHIESLLFKVNGVATPAQTAFYYAKQDIRQWNASNPDFNKPDPTGALRAADSLVSGGALVLLGDVRTTDVLSVSIGKLQKVALPPPIQFPAVSFGVATMSVNEAYTIVQIPVNMAQAWTSPASAEIVFGPDTTIKDQCCRTTINDVGQTIQVMHFDRDIQDYDTDPKLPINSRIQYTTATLPGRYLVNFPIGATSTILKIKIVKNDRPEGNRVLHLKVDPAKLTNLNPGSTLQEFHLTIVNTNPPYTGTAPRYTDLLSDGGILANECLRCHNSVLNRGGYDITNYEQMIEKGILIPGDPVNSLMFYRMNAANIPGLDPMPLTGLIDPIQRFDVEQWILQGAHNN